MILSPVGTTGSDLPHFSISMPSALVTDPGEINSWITGLRGIKIAMPGGGRRQYHSSNLSLSRAGLTEKEVGNNSTHFPFILQPNNS